MTMEEPMLTPSETLLTTSGMGPGFAAANIAMFGPLAALFRVQAEAAAAMGACAVDATAALLADLEEAGHALAVTCAADDPAEATGIWQEWAGGCACRACAVTTTVAQGMGRMALAGADTATGLWNLPH